MATFTTKDGTRIDFSRPGTPRSGAPRIVLIHSLALDRSVWDGVVTRLGRDAEILTYDCRGHGRSDRRPGPYTATLFAEDLAQLLDHLGWDKAAIAGCSMGGSVALAFAGLYPSRVTALGLSDTTAWYGADAPEQFGKRADAARAKGMEALVEFQLSRWVSEEFRASHEELLTRATDIFIANDLDCYAASCELLGQLDQRSQLPSFRMPVAIIVGEEDYATPVAMAREMHEAMPQSTLMILPGARHLTPLEHPDRIASELLALLGRP